MGKYINVDESYDADAGMLRMYLVEEDGAVTGIYWDEDFAIQNARWTADDGVNDQVLVREVDFRRGEGEVIFTAKDRDDAEETDDEEANQGIPVANS